MLGAIIGDIVGSVYEFNNYKATNFQPFFHPRAFFTDDTVCTVAVADALLNSADPSATLHAWGRRYWNNGGWGGRFADWLRSDNPQPYGSYGNGAAMRVSPAGFLAQTLEDAIQLAERVTKVTHNHPEGMKGAAATAAAIYLARAGFESQSIRLAITERFAYDLSRSVDDIRSDYSFNETCQETVPQALVCALSAKSYEEAIRNAVSIGGDSDTVAAIAGGVAEAMFGIPEAMAERGLGYLPSDMQQIVALFYRRGMSQTGPTEIAFPLPVFNGCQGK